MVNLQMLAKHYGISVPKNLNRHQVRNLIVRNLSEAYNSSVDSIAMNAVLLQIKLKIDSNGQYLSPEARLKTLKNIIEQRFKGRKIKSFMPAFEPSVSKLLTALLKEAKDVEPSLRTFCENVIKGNNPAKRFTRNVVLVESSEKSEEQKIKEQLENIAQKYKKSYSKSVVFSASPVPTDITDRTPKQPIADKAPQVLRSVSLDTGRIILSQYAKQLALAVSSTPTIKDEILPSSITQSQTLSADDPLKVIRPPLMESSKAILKQYLRYHRQIEEEVRKHKVSHNKASENNINNIAAPVCA